MNKALLFAGMLLCCFSTFSQQEIRWEVEYSRKDKLIGFHAMLSDGWHVYSTQLENDGGPIQTEFEFASNPLVQLVGGIMEPTPKEKFDPNFDMLVKYFDKQVTFYQKVKAKKNTVLEVGVVYMICNDTMCLPPVEKKFEINIKK